MYKVVIIEDEKKIRNGLKYTIDWVKMECIVIGDAANGREGIKIIKNLAPDIVFLDINMPVMNGIEMLESIGTDHEFATIIISGYDDFQYARKSIRFRVVDYLLKPVDPEELFRAIERAKQILEHKKGYKIMQTELIKPEEINVLNMDIWNSQRKNSASIDRVITYIKENYNQKISITDLTFELDRSATYLNKRFKETTSYTFNEFVNRYRIQKAIELLQDENNKISMIALDVGFSNYRYFIKVFKRYTGALPSDFLEYFKGKTE